MKIRVTFEPNIDIDHQTFDIKDTDMTQEEWSNLSDVKKKEILFEICSDNIYGMITEIVED